MNTTYGYPGPDRPGLATPSAHCHPPLPFELCRGRRPKRAVNHSWRHPEMTDSPYLCPPQSSFVIPWAVCIPADSAPERPLHYALFRPFHRRKIDTKKNSLETQLSALGTHKEPTNICPLETGQLPTHAICFRLLLLFVSIRHARQPFLKSRELMASPGCLATCHQFRAVFIKFLPAAACFCARNSGGLVRERGHKVSRLVRITSRILGDGSGLPRQLLNHGADLFQSS